ncbi:hypothetical protein F442_23097, partial [Phytophthora nicotianae P10297]
ISSDMFDILYDGMLSIKGIAGAVANMTEPTAHFFPPTEAQYMTSHMYLDAEVLTELWLTHTKILSRLCLALMKDAKCDVFSALIAHKTIYDVKRNLRPPEDCKHRLAATLKALDPTAISVKQSEWEGCVASNFVAVISMLPRISILKQGE